VSKWRPVDCIIFCLTVTICAVVIGSVFVRIYDGIEITESQGDRLLNLVLALVAVINGYVVSTIARFKNDN